MDPTPKFFLQRLGALLAALIGTLLGVVSIFSLTRCIWLFISRPNFILPILTIFTLSLLLGIGIGFIEKQPWKRGGFPILVMWSVWAISLSSCRWMAFPDTLLCPLICAGLMSLTLIMMTLITMAAAATANKPKLRALLPWHLQIICTTSHLFALFLS